jgi:hypothetical protein
MSSTNNDSEENAMPGNPSEEEDFIAPDHCAAGAP